MNNDNQHGRNISSEKASSQTRRRIIEQIAIKKIIVLGIILAIALSVSTLLLKPLIPEEYLTFLQISQMAIIGYFVIEIIGNAFYKLSSEYFKDTAKSIKRFIEIAGAIVIIAITISYLSRDPLVAASISTISGLVVGFASQNLIGNIIAGLYLAITRPFKIGDRITVFGDTGIVYDIGLLYSRLLMENGDIVLASNSSMVTTTVILHKGKTELSPGAAH
jgi:small-conductance mechanosensitive channel